MPGSMQAAFSNPATRRSGYMSRVDLVDRDTKAMTTRVGRAAVTGAKDDEEAERVARAIAGTGRW